MAYERIPNITGFSHPQQIPPDPSHPTGLGSRLVSPRATSKTNPRFQPREFGATPHGLLAERKNAFRDNEKKTKRPFQLHGVW